MERYYRMVIDLLKQIVKNGSVDPERILEVKKVIASAQTEAKILGKPQDGFTRLMDDLNSISL